MSHYYATTTTLDTLMVGVKFDTATTALAGLAIEEAQDEINKYISQRYDVATYVTSTAYSTNPPMLKTLCQRLAQGYSWIYMARGNNDEARKRGELLIKQVMKNLVDLRDNDAELLDSAGSKIGELDPTMPVLSNTEDRASTFDEDDPLNWAVDSNKLDDIKSDRNT